YWFRRRRRLGVELSITSSTSALILNTFPFACTTAPYGVLFKPAAMGIPTKPSRPTTPTSTLLPSLVTITKEVSPKLRKYPYSPFVQNVFLLCLMSCSARLPALSSRARKVTWNARYCRYPTTELPSLHRQPACPGQNKPADPRVFSSAGLDFGDLRRNLDMF